MRLALTALIALILTTPADAAPVQPPAKGYSLARVVVVMRHGIRPPTKPQVVPAEVTQRTWPQWDVPYGYLTSHGEQAVTQVARFDAAAYAGLWDHDCATTSPKAPQNVRIIADSDQRTIRTAQAYAAVFAACASPVEHADEGVTDTRFSPFEADTVLDPALAMTAARDALPPGGLPALDAANRARLDAISTVLGCTTTDCRLSARPTVLDPGKGRVKIAGGIDTGSTIGQVLMLEYTDGKPMSDVGWGLVDKAQIRDFLTLHALEFQLVARPKAIAEFGAKPLLAEVRRGLFATDTARYTVLVGHDSNLAYLGGALGLHWQGGDFPADDPPPAGAIIFELWRNARGAEKVVVRFRAQTLDEMRNLTPVADSARTTLRPQICGRKTACKAAKVSAALSAIIGN